MCAIRVLVLRRDGDVTGTESTPLLRLACRLNRTKILRSTQHGVSNYCTHVLQEFPELIPEMFLQISMPRIKPDDLKIIFLEV